ncbi:uncharacterized protein LOC133739433 isoform X2 [Rosa rugosa]|uniref:uncharacterized protein LOC133739433 isoform X2 n=1 Tax=Rosa rugosa TaxID=74645 RepID=UPI002B414E6F|nr:uncharacterized protein LOC133739433 isoform X2 [Rosa rugosa]
MTLGFECCFLVLKFYRGEFEQGKSVLFTLSCRRIESKAPVFDSRCYKEDTHRLLLTSRNNDNSCSVINCRKFQSLDSEGLDGDPQRALCQFRFIKLLKLEDDIGTLRLAVSKF